ncbi:hypothetical protein V6Z12_D04G001300 [Gossypium hirsutum]
MDVGVVVLVGCFGKERNSGSVLAFRDIAPQAPMHILIIPKSKDGLTGLSKVSLFRTSAIHINPRFLSGRTLQGVSMYFLI